jgi:hypothetical protein
MTTEEDGDYILSRKFSKQMCSCMPVLYQILKRVNNYKVALVNKHHAMEIHTDMEVKLVQSALQLAPDYVDVHKRRSGSSNGRLRKEKAHFIDT